MRWTDTYDIAIELEIKHPDVDVVNINFVKLRELILQLQEFHDDPKHSNERILEAIQAAWIEERE